MLFSLVAGCATAPQRAATPQATASEPARQTLRYQVEGVSVIRRSIRACRPSASPTSSLRALTLSSLQSSAPLDCSPAS